MGGTLLLEAVGVTLSPGSTGILAGFFTGWRPRRVVLRVFRPPRSKATGSSDAAADRSGHTGGNNLCGESGQPIHAAGSRSLPGVSSARRQSTTRLATSGPITAGGEWVLAPGKIQMEIQEFVNGVGATPVTLYDGALANLPGVVPGCARQQHQSDWNHARREPDESGVGLGGKHAAERRPLHAARWHHGGRRGMSPGAHRQDCLSTPGTHRLQASRSQ